MAWSFRSGTGRPKDMPLKQYLKPWNLQETADSFTSCYKIFMLTAYQYYANPPAAMTLVPI
jgi:hypothetical protein